MDDVICWRDEDRALHKSDGPAVILPDGTRRWYKRGQIHRIDGPATIRSDGSESWAVYNTHYEKEEYIARVTKIQRLFRSIRARRLVKLLTKNRQAIELFYSPDGIGGKWHKKSMEMMFGI